MLEPFFGNFKCLIGSLEVTGYFSASSREKSRQWSQKTNKRTYCSPGKNGCDDARCDDNLFD